jgi:hypothetical protein
MPPPSYFSNDIVFWEEELENEENEPDKDSFLAESQSLLEFADDSLYQSTYLDFHYRSQHPDLIAFSNAGFYGSRLVPMPAVSDYKAMHFNAINGTYAQGINMAEAKAIVNFLYEFAASKLVLPTLGVGTFNIHQRDLVQDLLWETAQKESEKAVLLEKMQEAGLFVKNLENIQGDERDVMIIGTTFGTDEQGKFRQAFGPVNQEKGYRLLNVLITRAKQQIHVFTSIPEVHYQFFEDGLKAQGNTGKAIFYAYLSYVRAVSEGNESRKEYILNHLKSNQTSSEKRAGNTIPAPYFIDESIQQKFEQQLNNEVAFGGFKLKKVLTKNQNNFMEIVQEQKAVHPNVAYRYKLFRKEILQKYGIKSYPIAGYQWWKNIDKEINALEEQYLRD